MISEDLVPVVVNGISILVLPVDSTDPRATLDRWVDARGSSAAWARADLVLDCNGRVLKAKAGVQPGVSG